MKLRTIIATATTAAVLASTGVAIAGASGNSSPHSAPAPASASPSASTPSPAAPAGVFAGRFRVRRLRLRKMLRGAGDIVTKAIGIDRATLRAGLASGKTIAEIATDNHVDPQTVIDALVSAAKAQLDAAVTAGKITSARAAKIEARVPARVAKLVNNWHPKRLRNATAS